MARKKIVNIFNKNHITIIKEENVYFPCIRRIDKNEPITRYIDCTSNTHGYYKSVNYSKLYFYKKGKLNNKVEYKEEKQRLKSPLGFYYTKTVRIYPKTETKENIKRKTEIRDDVYTLKVWEFRYDTYRYVISYMTSRNNSGINTETHPWDIGADKSNWDDHFVDDLKKEVDKIIEFATDNKMKLYKKRYYKRDDEDDYSISSVHDVKREIYTDLFGYPDGPKFQTNDMKILAHGFDLKVSFRNRKE